MFAHTNLHSSQLHRLIRHKKIILAGNNKLKIYGKLDCTSGKRLLKSNRVFFASEEEALQAGFRPCGKCMRDEFLNWKVQNNGSTH